MKAGLIGYGNMGSALARGIHRKFPDSQIAVFDTDANKKILAESECSALAVDSIAELCSISDILILAIKPQILRDFATREKSSFKEKALISLLAGTSIAKLRDQLKPGQIARFMPNIAAGIGEGTTAVAFSPESTDLFKKNAMDIAESCGTVFEMEEALFSAFTALSGSGIAYLLQILHAMGLGAVKEGISYQQAIEIAASTMRGAAGLIEKGADHPIALLSRVTSPKGTTIEAVSELEKHGLSAAIIRAIEAASKRADTLEQL